MSSPASDIPDRRSLRHRVYEILEQGRGEDRVSGIVDVFLIILIVANVVAFVLETVPSISTAWGWWLHEFEVFSVAVFTIEYVLRLWSCLEVSFLKRLPPWQARLRFAMRPSMLIDLAAILPFYLHYFLIPIDLRLLRVLRLMRFLKLARYSPAMHTLVRVLINERRALMGAVMLVLTALLFSASVMYYLEHTAQPEHFGSIPQAAWWAMVTLTTVGYGDVVPITVAGKMFAGLVMLCGLVVLALPIAIIATGFSQEVGRRDFVLTWSMMSKIPLFANLDATAVADIMHYLHAHNFPPHWEVLPKGSGTDAMYFIAAGRVRVADERVLHAGDFFGELEMLEQLPSDVAYMTETRARILKLGREDFLRLQLSHPGICAEVRAVADKRRAQLAARQATPA